MVFHLVLPEVLANILKFFPPEVIVFLLSMVPVIEHRGAIPLGIIILGMPWWSAFLFAALGNMVPIPFLLRFLSPVESWLRKYRSWDRFISFVYHRTFRRAESRMNRYRDEILVTFVAIPLPLTGGWHGSLIAFLFDIKFSKAMTLIWGGLWISAALVTAVTVFIPRAIGF